MWQTSRLCLTPATRQLSESPWKKNQQSLTETDRLRKVDRVIQIAG